MAPVVSQRRNCTFLLTSLATAAFVCSAQAQSNLPDLTVQIEAPSSVTVDQGQGYEVRLIIANTQPPATPPTQPAADPSILPPPGITPGRPIPGGATISTGGADVQQVDLVFGSDVGSAFRRVSLQAQPSIQVTCALTPQGSRPRRACLVP
jgi:hypothetical protein